MSASQVVYIVHLIHLKYEFRNSLYKDSGVKSVLRTTSIPYIDMQASL